ncbi:MAG: type IV secretion system protein VirB3 [Rhodopila sp.]
MSEADDIAARRAALEDTLFLALTRPAMMLGVPSVGLMLNVVGSIVVSAWLGMGSWHIMAWIVVIMPTIHFVMKFMVAKDHNLFRTKILFIQTQGQSGLDGAWGGSTVTPIPAVWPKKSKDLDVSV